MDCCDLSINKNYYDFSEIVNESSLHIGYLEHITTHHMEFCDSYSQQIRGDGDIYTQQQNRDRIQKVRKPFQTCYLLISCIC